MGCSWKRRSGTSDSDESSCDANGANAMPINELRIRIRDSPDWHKICRLASCARSAGSYPQLHCWEKFSMMDTELATAMSRSSLLRECDISGCTLRTTTELSYGARSAPAPNAGGGKFTSASRREEFHGTTPQGGWQEEGSAIVTRSMQYPRASARGFALPAYILRVRWYSSMCYSWQSN